MVGPDTNYRHPTAVEIHDYARFICFLATTLSEHVYGEILRTEYDQTSGTLTITAKGGAFDREATEELRACIDAWSKS
jgi:hypothetical protein